MKWGKRGRIPHVSTTHGLLSHFNDLTQQPGGTCGGSLYTWPAPPIAAALRSRTASSGGMGLALLCKGCSSAEDESSAPTGWAAVGRHEHALRRALGSAHGPCGSPPPRNLTAPPPEAAAYRCHPDPQAPTSRPCRLPRDVRTSSTLRGLRIISEGGARGRNTCAPTLTRPAQPARTCKGGRTPVQGLPLGLIHQLPGPGLKLPIPKLQE